MILLLFAFISPKADYSLSPDLLHLTITGVNEEITREDVMRECSLTRILSVSIGIGIVKIGQSAFYGASSLQNVNLPQSTLKILDTECFTACISLQSIVIPEGVTTLSTRVFSGCSSLVNVTLPSSLSSVSGNIFVGTSKILNIFMPIPGNTYFVSSDHKVLSKGDNIAIACSTGCKSISIPDSITEIQYRFIYNTDSINEIIFSKAGNLKVIRDGAFQWARIPRFEFQEGLITLENGCLYRTKTTYIYLPSTIEYIGDILDISMTVNVSEGCKALWSDSNGVVYNGNKDTVLLVPSTINNLTLRSELENLNIAQIRSNRNIIELHISNESKDFRDYKNGIYDKNFISLKLFAGGLSTIQVHPSCEGFADYSTSSTIITKIVYESNLVKNFGTECFISTKITNFSFPPNIESLGYICFSYSQIKGKYVFPSSLKSLSRQCFEGCIQLTQVDFSKCLNLTTLTPYLFSGCSNLENVSLPPNLVYVDDSCFAGCPITNLKIPSSVTKLGQKCFHNCNQLSIIFDITNSLLKVIDENAFLQSGLTSIKLPNSVKTLCQGCFMNCTKLTDVIFEDESRLENVQDLAFLGSNSLHLIHFGENLKTIGYQGLSELYGLKNISVARSNKLYESIDGILFTRGGDTLVSFPGGIDKIIIGKGIKKIRDYAFFKCIKLEMLQFSDDAQLESIGSNTFLGCSGLEIIKIPSATSEIAEKCFSGCINLREVKFGAGSELERIRSSCFKDCVRLSSVEFGSDENGTTKTKLKYIEDNAFENCPLLYGFLCPSSVLSIGVRAFYGCLRLSLFDCTSNNTSNLNEICESAFEGCSSLEEFTIASTVSSMGINCFKGCSKLTRIWYCGSTFFPNSCFEGCPAQFVGVPLSYPFFTLGGLNVHRILDRHCHTPTLLYTQVVASETVKYSAILNPLIFDNESKKF